MNYYPQNFYPNYNYNQYPNYMQNQQPQQNLQGKIVESEDMARVADVPMGSYAIFPKADFSEIYIKTWNNNGTTNLSIFKPFVKPEEPKGPTTEEVILERLQKMEEKIDSMINKPAIRKEDF